MKTRPILFSTPMVQAILNGTKKQTRRAIKSRHGFFIAYTNPDMHEEGKSFPDWPVDKRTDNWMECPYGNVGDVIWVREAWRLLGYNDDAEILIEFKGGTRLSGDPDLERVEYWADKCEKLLDQQAKKDNVIADEEAERYTWRNPDLIPWKPSIHMPRDIARIFLKVTNVRIERLQDISEEDCLAEGVQVTYPNGQKQPICYNYLKETYSSNPLNSFKSLWQSINGHNSWNDNPYVWVVEFERCLKPPNF